MGELESSGVLAEKACSEAYLVLSSRVCRGYGYGDTPQFG